MSEPVPVCKSVLLTSSLALIVVVRLFPQISVRSLTPAYDCRARDPCLNHWTCTVLRALTLAYVVRLWDS